MMLSYLSIKKLHIKILSLSFLLGSNLIAQINNGTNTLSNNSSSSGNGNTGSGSYSFSSGVSNTTSGGYSCSFGQNNISSGLLAISGGYASQASGLFSISFGFQSIVGGNNSMGFGRGISVGNNESIVIGYYSNTSAINTIAFGRFLTASNTNSFIIGNGISTSNRMDNNIANSLMIGFNSDVPTLFIGSSSGTGTTGNVGIGTTAISGAKLSVDGTIRAREVVINLTTWSDFVFDKDYDLLSLSDLEKFITINKHLPNVPSEKEVLKNGVSLGEMNAILLEKIEELTIYIINLEKRIKEIESSKY
ncbi:MAG: hypothetical protein P1U44_03585 [Vicingaceae bacterium]|nr:hypothetical protein [Vicingaceae bacterium]